MSRVAYIDLDGTLLGPGGSLLRGADGAFSDAGVRALALLEREAVPVVLVSGRSQIRLDTVARALGAAGTLAEMGALEAGYPTRAGQSVHDAIAETGIADELLLREPGLEPHRLAAAGGREGSHVLRGRARPEAAEWVRGASSGALRLADNGRIADDEHVYHLLPAAASKAAAVESDRERRAAPRAVTLAVGDSRQDLDMGRAVGRVAIVANGASADPAVRADAAWVTRGSYGAGVLEAVAAWLAA